VGVERELGIEILRPTECPIDMHTQFVLMGGGGATWVVAGCSSWSKRGGVGRPDLDGRCSNQAHTGHASERTDVQCTKTRLWRATLHRAGNAETAGRSRCTRDRWSMAHDKQSTSP
jgi:hypothetical protein